MDQPTDKGDYIGLPWINGGLKRINCALYERLVETHLDVDVISNSDVGATVTLERWATLKLEQHWKVKNLKVLKIYAKLAKKWKKKIQNSERIVF